MDAIGSTTQRSTPARSGSSSPSRRASGTFSPLASPIMQHSSILLDQHQQHSLFMPDDIQQFLRSNPLFHNRASDEFLRELASNMHIRHHQTGDIIVKEGEIGRAMFFIVRGLAVVGSQDSDSIFAELSPGNLFGEIGVLFDLPRTATVFAKTKCLLVALTKAEFQRISDTYPEVSAEIMAEARSRYAYLLKRGKVRQALFDGSRRSSGNSNSTNLSPSNSTDPATVRYYSKFSAYQFCPAEVLNHLRNKEEPLHRYQPGDMVSDSGDQDKKLIIVSTGKVDLIDCAPGSEKTAGTTLTTVGPRTFIGASLFIHGAPRRERVMVSGDGGGGCALYILTPADYERLIATEFPWFSDNLRKAADRKQNYFTQSTDDLLTIEPAIKECWSSEHMQDKQEVSVNHRDSSEGSLNALDLFGRAQARPKRLSRSFHQLDEVPENLISLIDGYAGATSDYLLSDPISMQENLVTKFKRRSSQNLFISADTLLNSDSGSNSSSAESSSVNLFLSTGSLRKLSPLNETFGKQMVDANDVVNVKPLTGSESAPPPLSAAVHESISIEISEHENNNDDVMDVVTKTASDINQTDAEEEEGSNNAFEGKLLPPSFNPHLSLSDPKRRRASVAVWADSSLSVIASQKAAAIAHGTDSAHLNGSTARILPSRLAIIDLKQSLASLKSENESLTKSELDISDSMDELQRDLSDPFQSSKLIVQIAKYLPFKSLWRLRTVNSTTYRALRTSQFMSTIDLSPYNKLIDDQSVECIARYASELLEVLVLKNCWKCANNSLKHLGAHSKNLEILDASGAWDVTDEGLISLSHGCRRLRAVDFSNCRKITDTGLNSLMTNCPALCDLFLSYCKCLSDNTMTSISNHSPAIRRLNFQRCLGITDIGFRQLNVTSYPKFQELILSDCSFLTDAAMQDLASCCPNLRHLNISFCCALTELAFEHLTQGCKRLSIIDASFCGTAVTDRILDLISRELQCLERLSVRGCVQVTAIGLQALIANAKWLTTLNISGCKYITTDVPKSLPPELRLLSAQTPLVELIGVTGSRQIGSTHVRRFTSP